MFNVNDIVIVKSEKDFEKDILNGLCYKTDTESIYYRNDRNHIPFSSEMKKFYNKKFVVANYLKVRCGSICLVIANQEREKKGLPNPQVHDVNIPIKVAIEAIKELIEQEK